MITKTLLLDNDANEHDELAFSTSRASSAGAMPVPEPRHLPSPRPSPTTTPDGVPDLVQVSDSEEEPGGFGYFLQQLDPRRSPAPATPQVVSPPPVAQPQCPRAPIPPSYRDTRRSTSL